MQPSIVDSHVHVWAHDQTLARPAPSASPLHQGNSDIEALQATMQAESVSGAVLVQYIGYLWDNSYVAKAIKARPDMFVGVCRVNTEDRNAPDHLRNLVETCGFQGVRIGPMTGAMQNWLSGDHVDPLFACATELAVPVVVLANSAHLEDLIKALDRHPDLNIVIDHLADCDAKNPEHRRLLEILAANSRVQLKTGHIWATSQQGYPWRDKQAEIKLACDVFGASRVMWGSDWSFNLAHGTYRQAATYLHKIADFLTSAEIDMVMGGNARRLWHFAQPIVAHQTIPPHQSSLSPPAADPRRAPKVK